MSRMLCYGVSMLLSRIALVVGLLAAASSAVTAQSPPGGSLTMQAALDRALAANPTIAAARLRGPIDMAGLEVARERLNPEASIEFQKETPRQSYGFSVPLELGGKRAKRIAVGEATVRAGEAEVAVVIAQVRNDVRRAYFGLLVAETRQSLMQEIRDISIRARDAAQERFDAGSAPRLEVMQAELALASADNDVAAARGEADGARAGLNALLAQPLDTAITLSGAFDSGTSLTRESAIALAHDASTELRVIDRQIETQRARLALAGALRNPDVIPSAALTHVCTGVRLRLARRRGHRGSALYNSSRRRGAGTKHARSIERATPGIAVAHRWAGLLRRRPRPDTTAALPALPRRDHSAGARGRAGRAGQLSARSNRHRLAAAGASIVPRCQASIDRCRLAVSEFAGRPRARDRRATAVRTLMESRRWLFALAMSAALGAGACTQSTPEEVESEAVVPVRTVAAEKGTIRGVVRATGLVTPAPGAELIVIAPEAARITEIHLGEGERVSAVTCSCASRFRARPQKSRSRRRK